NGENLGALLDLGAPQTNAGAYSVHWAFAGDANYNAAAGDATVALAKANATLHVSGAHATYDGQAHGATATATGVNGEDLGPVALRYNGGAALPVGAGYYAVHAAFGGSANYNAAADDSAGVDIDRATPVFSGLGPARVTAGTAQTTLGGKLSLGALAPTGS